MADTTPRVREIIDTLKARLQQITVAGGYRTDAGLDVRTERSELVPTAPYLALARLSIVRPQEERATAREREVQIVVEAHVPASLTDAAARAEDISEDIEDALTEYLQQPMALPLSFRENALLDRPEGLPVMVAQVLFETRYRR